MYKAAIGLPQSHTLPSVNWRPRKAGGGASVQAERPKNQGESIVEEPVHIQRLTTRSTDTCGQEIMDVPGQMEKSEFTLPLPFCPNLTLKILDDASSHWWRWIFLLNVPIQMPMSFWNTLTNTKIIYFTSYRGIT